MVTRVKLKAGEKLTPDNIRRAIKSLEDGGTKKSACEILGIKYNTTRLQKIIDDFTAREATEKRLREERKNKPLSDREIVDIISNYLELGSVDAVSKLFYRTSYVINQVLEHYGAKLHSPKTDYFNPMLLPDICMADSFSIGELVWSSRHNTLAIIKKDVGKGVYAIRVLGKYEKDAYQRVEDLGSLRHLEALGINFKNIKLREYEHSESDDE